MLAVGNFLAKGYDLWVVANINANDIDFWLKFYNSNPLAYISYIHDLWQDGELFVSFEEANNYAVSQSLESGDKIKHYDFRDIAATERMNAFMRAHINGY